MGLSGQQHIVSVVIFKELDDLHGAGKIHTRFHAMQETRVRFLGQEDPLEEEMATHSSILTGDAYGQRSLADYGPHGHQESDMTAAT